MDVHSLTTSPWGLAQHVNSLSGSEKRTEDQETAHMAWKALWREAGALRTPVGWVILSPGVCPIPEHGGALPCHTYAAV